MPAVTGTPALPAWWWLFLYSAAALACWAAAARLPQAPGSPERRIWHALAFLFLALGAFRSLDLHTTLTGLGRRIAAGQGWYLQRHLVLLVFILFIAGASLAVGAWLWRRARHTPLAARFALAGATLAVGYIAIRAASLHGMDNVLGRTLGGMRVSWILEGSALLMTLAAGTARWWAPGPSEGAGQRRP